MTDIYIRPKGCWFGDEEVCPKQSLISVGYNIDLATGEMHALLCLYRADEEIIWEGRLTEDEVKDVCGRLRSIFSERSRVQQMIAEMRAGSEEEYANASAA